VIGRLQTETTLRQTNAGLRTVFAGLAAQYPETNDDRSALVRSFGRFPAQNRAGDMAAVFGLLVLVSLVLLVICGNVAGMMLARNATREREIAVRLALGSSRVRLVRQLMAEAVVLALAGGTVGTLVGFWLTGFATPARLGVAMTGLEFKPSAAVLFFSVGLTAASTLAVGLFPALRFSRPDLVSTLKDEAGGGGRRVGRVHRVAASAQAGIALALLVTCSLFVRATGLLEERGVGFDPDKLLVTWVQLFEDGHGSFDEAMTVLDRLKEATEAVPGVTSVSLADGIPLDLTGNFTRVSRADRPAEAGAGERVEFTRADEDYFETIGTPILRGRGFAAGDDSTSEQVVIITEDLAETLWPGGGALGQRLRFPTSNDPDLALTVVGTLGHVASSNPGTNLPSVFVPLRQRFMGYEPYGLLAMVVMRGTLELSALVVPIQAAILAVDPTLAFPRIVTSESLVARSTGPQRATANISAGLGILALILSAIGVYGVVAFGVATRTREIGVRMALGATRRQVLRDVFVGGVRLAVPGLVVGGALAAVMAVVMRSLLMGLSPVDPVSFGFAAGVLLLVVLLASLIPARRASSLDPMHALRHE
jgi:predicted permease